ncbi:MAG TPA: c-type cytochrome [Chloroflexota bacterium]|nr:c-type cytochrome [Chloroflexota bacterium]HUM67493.1 c-type cytochrome [Chloroflexota bacterium]
MKKVLKWIGIIFAGLVGLVVVAAVVGYVTASSKINQSYDVPVTAVVIPDDEAAIDRGEPLVWAIAGCTECHGDNLGGMLLVDDPAIGTFYGSNLTAGAGGAGTHFSEEDWVRAIRHGVGTDGKSLLLMPSNTYHTLPDEDLGAMLAYLQSLEPVDNEVPEQRLGPLGYAMVIIEPVVVPAALIDHTVSNRTAVAPGVTAAYGQYLVDIGHCRSCHGEELNGQPTAAGLDHSPARNLTPGGQLAGWSEEEFIQTIRTGITPDGHALCEPMTNALAHMQRQTDDELRAIFLYLQSLPPLENGYESQ